MTTATSAGAFDSRASRYPAAARSSIRVTVPGRRCSHDAISSLVSSATWAAENEPPAPAATFCQ